MSESSRRHKAEAPVRLRFALVTCSSSRYASLKEGKSVEDPSVDFIADRLKKTGHSVVSRSLVADDQNMIRHTLEQALKDGTVEAVILCGGTGIAPTDVTIETVTPMLQKLLPGFGEIFRKISYDTMGSAAILSRAVAGVVEGKAVFCIPGSIDAVKACLDRLILSEAGHIVKHARESDD
jgi:molybdenum cofactor biosynthesis protein B